MAPVYRFDVQKGTSVVFTPHYVAANGYSTRSPYVGPDPLYLDIVEAEGVKVTPSIGPSGANIMETDSSEGKDENDTGIHISHLRLPLNWFDIRVCYRFTASAIAAGIDFSPLFYLSNDFNVTTQLLLGAFIQGSDLHIEIDGGPAVTTLRSYTRPVSALSTDAFSVFRVMGRNGTLSGTTRLSDGWIKVYWDDTLIYDIDSIQVDLGVGGAGGIVSDPAAIITDVSIGDRGLIGQFAYLEIYDDVFVTNAAKGTCCADAGAAGGGHIPPDGTVE